MGERESAVISRIGNKYLFLKLQNNIFDVGTIAFSGGVPRIISSTDSSEDNVFSALGFQESNEEHIPVFCAQKLGRQAKNAWELSDYRSSIPFENIKLETKVNRLPFYEANILSALITNQSINFSFNLFEDEGIVEFFFDEVYSEIDDVEDEVEAEQAKQDIIEKRQGLEELKEEGIEDSTEKSVEEKQNTSVSFSGYAFSVVVIVACFIGFNYLKLQNQINSNFFGFGKNFKIERSGIDKIDSQANNAPPLDLIKESRAISTAVIKLLTQTDLNRYNGLTITKSFLSLEYLSGTNPNIENILGLEPTSFTVEATGSDSTIFLWYYSFEATNC